MECKRSKTGVLLVGHGWGFRLIQSIRRRERGKKGLCPNRFGDSVSVGVGQAPFFKWDIDLGEHWALALTSFR